MTLHHSRQRNPTGGFYFDVVRGGEKCCVGVCLNTTPALNDTIGHVDRLVCSSPFRRRRQSAAISRARSAPLRPASASAPDAAWALPAVRPPAWRASIGIKAPISRAPPETIHSIWCSLLTNFRLLLICSPQPHLHSMRRTLRHPMRRMPRDGVGQRPWCGSAPQSGISSLVGTIAGVPEVVAGVTAEVRWRRGGLAFR